MAIPLDTSINSKERIVNILYKEVKFIKFTNSDAKNTAGKFLYPKRSTAAEAIPETGHIAVESSGGKASKKPSFAGKK